MSDALATYLQDHLAGAEVAIDMLHALSEQYRGATLGTFFDASNAARVPGALMPTITCGWRFTTSRPSSGRRSRRPSAERMSRTRFVPSM